MILFRNIILSTVLSSLLLIAESSHSTSNDNDLLASLIGNMMGEEAQLAHNINLAGKQRMLTQRMSKLALLVSLKIKSKESQKKLDTYLKLYEQTLKGFREGDVDLGLTATQNADILKHLDAVEKLWKPFSKSVDEVVLKGAKAKEAVEYVVQHNEALLKSSNDLVMAYDKLNTSTDYLSKFRLHVVNVAGRQRMLIQKMTKEKLLVSELKQSSYSSKLKQSISEFDNALTALIHGDKKKKISKPTNKELIVQLKKVETRWLKLKPLFTKTNIDKKELNTIIIDNPIFLRDMNEVVKTAETVLEY